MSQTTATAATEQAEKPKTLGHALRVFKQPTPREFVKQREGWSDRQGNMHMVDYVEWHYVADLLDNVWPLWEFSIVSCQWLNGVAVATVALTLISESGNRITRQGIGTGTPNGSNAQAQETAFKKAEHDGLKRAAIKFGIARDLYQGEETIVPGGGNGARNAQTGAGGGQGAGYGPPPPVGEVRDPLAKSISDLVTPKQLGMIRALAREAGVEVDEECQAVLRCRSEELSKKAASSFIDHLKNLAQGGGANPNQGRLPTGGAAPAQSSATDVLGDYNADDLTDDDIPF